MKKILSLIFILSLGFSGKAQKSVETIAEFKEQQVTGVTVTHNGRIFANFPRWRESVKNSVVEVDNEGSHSPYPDKQWNSWKPDQPVSDSTFVAVQSVVASDDKLYVLDTRNPLWKGVVNNPRIFVFDLKTDRLLDILILSDGSFKSNSYTNDLRIDNRNGYIYITDSNEAGLIVYDLNNRSSRRVLDNHYSTKGEFSSLSVNGNKWGNNPVHSDGIAYNIENDRLYFHALTGYTLYSVAGEALRKESKPRIEEAVKEEATTPAPDGMIFDEKGNLYMADLENTAIVVLRPEGTIETIVQGDSVGWADTFSIYDDYLYFTDSKIHLAGSGVESMTFTINRIALE